MHKPCSAMLAIVLASTACTARDSTPSANSADCVPIGNDARRTFCALTYGQLLSNPREYNGRRIFIHAWAVRKGDEVLLFPSIDSYEGGEVYASLNVGHGKSYGRLLEYLSSRPELQPTRVKLGGTFLLNANQGTDSSLLKGEHVFRFGQLNDIDEFRI